MHPAPKIKVLPLEHEGEKTDLLLELPHTCVVELPLKLLAPELGLEVFGTSLSSLELPGEEAPPENNFSKPESETG